MTQVQQQQHVYLALFPICGVQQFNTPAKQTVPEERGGLLLRMFNLNDENAQSKKQYLVLNFNENAQSQSARLQITAAPNTNNRKTIPGTRYIRGGCEGAA